MSSMPRYTIALEEQFMSSNALDHIPSKRKDHIACYEETDRQKKLKDISPAGVRLKAMNAGQCTISVLSNIPGFSSADPAAVSKANDELKAATQAQPRFLGFASLPMEHAEAVSELQHCVDIGFKGALIDSHLASGRYYDDTQYWPVFAKAQELGVPIYIHPTHPTDAVQSSLFNGNYSRDDALLLGISEWGWHSDTALVLLRMYHAGVFWRYPDLKVVVGHMGEMIPFQLTRIDTVSQMVVKGQRTFREVWKKNIYVTTSGMFDLVPMACLLKTTPIDHIMYSVDWPWSTMEQGRAFLHDLKESGMVSEDELEMIAYKNAETLLGIRAESICPISGT